ncbi:MAG: hypothetical protein II050_05130, partial [Bacteroidaceae bacterium]|nr:hypothetical protein [Bacteroidaceae bacterium]
ETQLEQVRQMQLKVETTQQVVFIDSVVVPRAQLLPLFPLVPKVEAYSPQPNISIDKTMWMPLFSAANWKTRLSLPSRTTME